MGLSHPSSHFLINCLQVLQYRAARLVTNCSRFTPTAVLLHQCGWLSVRQLVHYHSLVLVFKTMQHGKPEYFQQYFSTEFPYETRLATGQGIRRGDQSQYEVSRTSFVVRSAAMWNMLPVQVRGQLSLDKFKKLLKSWLIENIAI